MKSVATWIFVLLAGGLIGGLIGEAFDPMNSVGPGVLGGMFFAICLRLFVFAPGIPEAEAEVD